MVHLMAEFWHHMPYPSIELDQFDEARIYRDGRDGAPRRGGAQRQIRAASQTRSANEDRSNLASILEVISISPQEYLPTPSRALARQDPYVGRTYGRRVTQINAAPLAGEWALKPIRVRRTNEWRSYAVCSIFGAVMGISGYVFLVEGGTGKGDAVQALTSTAAIAKPVEQRGRVSDSAFFETAPQQPRHEETPSPLAAYAIVAPRESPQGAFAPAQTYSPSFFAPREVQEPKPDPSLAPEKAEKARAAKLGSSEAAQRRKKPSQTASSGSEVLRKQPN
jgi:hypothetical protein